MKKLSQISPSVVPQWTPCEMCKGSNGWVTVPDMTSNGRVITEKMTRCQCVKAHAQRVADALKQMKGK